MASDDPRFNCPTCGKSYRWKPEMAGRSAKCGCGAKLVVPAERPAPSAAPAIPKVVTPTAPAAPAATAPAVAASSSVTRRPARPAPESGAACPWCGKTLPPAAVLCVNCGYNLKTKQRIAVVVEKVDVEDDDSEADQAAAAEPDGASPRKREAKSDG